VPELASDLTPELVRDLASELARDLAPKIMPLSIKIYVNKNGKQ